MTRPSPATPRQYERYGEDFQPARRAVAGITSVERVPSVNQQSYPIARRTDPPSSYVAAQEIEQTGRRTAQCKAVLEVVKRHPRRTSLELSRLSQLDRYTISRRLPELERRGLIRRGVTRNCTVNGRPMLTWVPVNEESTAEEFVVRGRRNRVIG